MGNARLALANGSEDEAVTALRQKLGSKRNGVLSLDGLHEASEA